MKNNKNKASLVFLVTLGCLLAFLWHQEAGYQSRLKEIRSTVSRLETSIYLLRVRARALKEEIEMINLGTTLKLKKLLLHQTKPFRPENTRINPLRFYRGPVEPD